jgi:type IV pilus assembly protein PilB
MALKDDILAEKLKNEGIKNEEIEMWLDDVKKLKISLEEYLYQTQKVDPKIIVKIKSDILNIPVKIFSGQEEVDINVVKLLDEQAAKNYKMVIFDKKDNTVFIGAVEPENSETQKAIEYFLKTKNFEGKIFLITPGDFYKVLRRYHDFYEDIKKFISDYRRIKPLVIEKSAIKIEGIMAGSQEQAPIVELVSLFIKEAVYQRASDIHFENMQDKFRVRYRIQGDLKDIVYLPKDIGEPIVSRLKVISDLKIDETRIPQSGRFRALIDNREIDFRISSLPTVNGEKIVIRILDPLSGLLNISDLGILSYHDSLIKETLEKPYGLILITGPTGSGKTTTLYAFLRYLNQEEVNIVTLEDPVEYRISGINQSQVRPEINYTFASGLREILRQDPDIIMVGEIRDEETAELAIHAALTGHLVLSTLHTNDAAGVIPRLIDLGVKKFLIPPTLILAEAQRLLRKLCQDCKVKVPIKEELKKEIIKIVNNLPKEAKNEIEQVDYVYEPKGCEKCNFKGYIGRIGIFEFLKMSPELQDIILKEFNLNQIKEIAKSQGMISLKEDGIIKALKGLVNINEVLRETV